MDISQDILNKFIVREDYLEWVNKETSIFAYLDLTNMFLFSGDSDLLGPLERLKVKGKKIGIVGVRGKVAGELHNIKDKFIDFGKFYTGKRVYIKSENPAFGGTA